MGCCVYELNGYGVWPYAQAGRNDEIVEFTQALFDARELAMERMTQDLFADFGLPARTPLRATRTPPWASSG